MNYELITTNLLGNGVTVARLTLDQLVQVRILVPQYFDSFALRFHKGLTRSVQVVRYEVLRRTRRSILSSRKKTELEYRVIEVNKAGEGQPSNTVMVVL